MTRLYLDLDGVMADFDAHFPAVFGLDHRSMADDAMWQTINAHPSYFRDMPPCPGAVEFFRLIEPLAPIVLTACPRTNYANAATQKRAWVYEHLGSQVTVLPVMGGHNKPLFMHAPGDILIDDFEKNTKAWSAAGGASILHRSFDETWAHLGKLLSLSVLENSKATRADATNNPVPLTLSPPPTVGAEDDAGAGMAEMAEIARIVSEWRHGPMLSPEALRQIAVYTRPSPSAKDK
jgi:hypothetical protein